MKNSKDYGHLNLWDTVSPSCEGAKIKIVETKY